MVMLHLWVRRLRVLFQRISVPGVDLGRTVPFLAVIARDKDHVPVLVCLGRQHAPRARHVAADVEQIVRAIGHDGADYVLSGLPFSTLPEGVGPAIAKATYDVIRPGGAFLVYQFSAKARDFMAKHFKRIDSGFEPLNVLPCQLFWGWKD